MKIYAEPELEVIHLEGVFTDLGDNVAGSLDESNETPEDEQP